MRQFVFSSGKYAPNPIINPKECIMQLLQIVVCCGNINLVMEIPFKRSKKGITIKIKVEPRSSRKGISGVMGDTLKVRVNSPPVGGAANEELIEVLSEELGIRKTTIKIIRGNSRKIRLLRSLA